MSEEFGADHITIVDDEGNEHELEVCEEMNYNGNDYMLFLPADIDEDDPDFGFIILRVIQCEDGTQEYEDVEDERLLNEVYERFMALIFPDDEEE